MYQDIFNSVEQGKNFSNEMSKWYTLNSQKDNRRVIVKYDESGNETYRFYKNNKSYSKAILRMLNKGN